MKQWLCCVSYLDHVLWCPVWTHKFQKYSWFTPLTTLSIHTADNTLLPLLFLRSVSILSGCPIINILFFTKMWSYSWTHSISLTYWVSLLHISCLTSFMNMETLAIFQAWICFGVLIGKCLIFIWCLVWIYSHKEELQKCNFCILCIFCFYRSHCK